MTKYYIASSWKNIETVRAIWAWLKANGHDYHDWSAYGFLKEEVARDGVDFIRHWKVRATFEADLIGIYDSDVYVMLAPCGNSSHIEAGIAFGLGKRMIHIGEPSKDCLYNIFGEFYEDPDEFFANEAFVVQGQND